jgi:hypothetical protein
MACSQIQKQALICVPDLQFLPTARQLLIVHHSGDGLRQAPVLRPVRHGSYPAFQLQLIPLRIPVLPAERCRFR